MATKTLAAEVVTADAKHQRLSDDIADPSQQSGLYHVVEYLHDNSTASVPICWVEEIEGETFAYWPTKYKSKEYRKAVLQSECPDKNQWDSFLAKVHFTGTLAECKSRERHLITVGSGIEEVPKYHKKKAKSSHKSPPTDHILLGTSSTAGVVHSATRSQSPQKLYSPERDNAKNQCQSCAECASCADYRDMNASFQRKVLKKLHQIAGELTLVTEGRPVVVEQLKLGELSMPLKTIEAVKNAENSLTPEMITKLKSSLRQYVGKSVWKTAVDMLQSILSIPVMRQLNWEGRNKGKIGFAKIAPKLSTAILDGAREATVDEFKPNDMRDRLMKVLVKAHKLEEARGVVAINREEPEAVLNPTEDLRATNGTGNAGNHVQQNGNQ